MSAMSEEYKNTFLATTRYGYLTTHASDGYPRTVPVWFDWDGQSISIFTIANSSKLKRIKTDPRVTLLVANNMSEHEAWVSFDGKAKIRLEGGIELAEKLATRYWDLTDPKRKATLESWKTAPEKMCLIELIPIQIRTYFE